MAKESKDRGMRFFAFLKPAMARANPPLTFYPPGFVLLSSFRHFLTGRASILLDILPSPLSNTPNNNFPYNNRLYTIFFWRHISNLWQLTRCHIVSFFSLGYDPTNHFCLFLWGGASCLADSVCSLPTITISKAKKSSNGQTCSRMAPLVHFSFHLSDPSQMGRNSFTTGLVLLGFLALSHPSIDWRENSVGSWSFFCKFFLLISVLLCFCHFLFCLYVFSTSCILIPFTLALLLCEQTEWYPCVRILFVVVVFVLNLFLFCYARDLSVGKQTGWRLAGSHPRYTKHPSHTGLAFWILASPLGTN